MKPAIALVAFLAAAAPYSGAAAKVPVTDCDRLAAHPQDVHKVAPGIEFESIDAAHAIAACRDALANFPDEPRFAYELARALDSGGQVLSAMEMYRRLADAGYVQAQVTMGISYLDGTFVETEPAKAAEWFRRAEQSGHAQAEFYLGLLYERGLGVTQNKEEAQRLLQRSVDAGYDRALVALGDLLHKAHNWCGALPLYLKASAKGFVAATIAYAGMLAGAECVAEDVDRAKGMLKPLAESGDAEAEAVYGNVLFFSARKSKAPVAEGLRWLHRAAEQDNFGAEQLLYLIYSGSFSQPESAFDAYIWASLCTRHDSKIQILADKYKGQLTADKLVRASAEIDRLIRNFPANQQQGLSDDRGI
jgi:TPR repeat protein